MSVFREKLTRKDVAIKLFEILKDRFLPPGMPLNDMTLGGCFRDAFLMADAFLKVEGMNTEQLMQYGRPPQQQPGPQQRSAPVPPNGQITPLKSPAA